MVTVEQYESHPEARELRKLGISGITAHEALLLNGEKQAIGVILDTNAELLARGIYANMNAVSDTDPDWLEKRAAMHESPLALSQYVCGQLIVHWTRIHFSTLNRAVVCEHDIQSFEVPGVAVLNPNTAPAEIMRPVGNLAFLTWMRFLLAS